MKFRVGQDLGKLLLQISRDHLNNFDHIKAFQVFSECGAPPEYALDLMLGEKIIIVNEETQECSLIDRYKDTYTDYPNILNLNSWILDKLQDNIWLTRELVANALRIIWEVATITIEIEEPKTSKYGTIESTLIIDGKNLIKIWADHDEEMRSLVEFEDPSIGTAYTLFDYLENFVKTGKKLIECCSWLIEQYGVNENIKIRLQDFRKLWEDINTVLIYVRNFDIASLKSVLKKYITPDKLDFEEYEKQIREIQKHPLYPVNIEDNYDAGFISPEGKVYAMRGLTANFIHLRLADMIFNEFGFLRDGTYGRDFQLMKLGWIKFHSGQILFDGYNNTLFGHKEVGISKEQIRELKKYGEARGGILYFGGGSKPLDINDLENCDNEQLTNLFD